MDCSLQHVYSSYVKFCNMLGNHVLSFEDWMVAREEPISPSLQAEANKLLEAVENRM